MENQIKIAIIAISSIIPLSSYFVLLSEQPELVEQKSSSKIMIATSFYPLYEFTKEIGQENVDVTLLVPQGIEPHDWEPTITDLQKIQQSNIIIINGLGFEKWVNQVIEINPKITLVDTSKGINLIQLETDNLDSKSDNHQPNPHIWLNPKNAKTQIKNIQNALSNYDPKNSEYYKINAEKYSQKLDLLDSKIYTELSDCKKDFITFHNAFSYFALEYGLNQFTVFDSTEPNSETTIQTLEHIINTANELNINVVYTEEGIDNRTAEVIAKEIHGKVLELSPIEIVEKNSSYISKMETNLNNLKEGLCH